VLPPDARFSDWESINLGTNPNVLALRLVLRQIDVFREDPPIPDGGARCGYPSLPDFARRTALLQKRALITLGGSRWFSAFFRLGPP